MARIAGVTLPNKRIAFSLPYIYGVGYPLAKKICKELHIDPEKKIETLSAEEINAIEKYISAHIKAEGDLRREIQENIKRLTRIKNYRGLRHIKKLPVRGQRTRTNARTRKGPKKTAGSGKKKLTKK